MSAGDDLHSGAEGSRDVKRVVSVSIGSSRRNHTVDLELLGQHFRVERIGTDGSMDKAVELIRQLDGQVAAFGMGGIDLYLVAGGRRYVIREAKRMARAARISPIVDGSGLKNTLERRVVHHLARQGMDFRRLKALVVVGVDRFGLSEALVEHGCRVTFGDLMFGVGVPIPIRSLGTLRAAAAVLAPLLVQLPFKYLYPTGQSQEIVTPKFPRVFEEADIIAGDFHYIRRYAPLELPGKIILTNTVTQEDVADLKRRGVWQLITTTPELEGRSFGTNVMEALLVAAAGGHGSLRPQEYDRLLDQLGFRPRQEILNPAPAFAAEA